MPRALNQSLRYSTFKISHVKRREMDFASRNGHGPQAQFIRTSKYIVNQIESTPTLPRTES